MITLVKDDALVNTRSYVLIEHGEAPRKTVQPQSIWLWHSQLIRCVELSDNLIRKEHRGAELKRYSPVLLGIAASAKVLTTREGYGPL
jgi:hypothetical protein